jgi:hypothetical protein
MKHNIILQGEGCVGGLFTVTNMFISIGQRTIVKKETKVENYDSNRKMSSPIIASLHLKRIGHRQRYHQRSLHCLSQQPQKVRLHPRGI